MTIARSLLVLSVCTALFATGCEDHTKGKTAAEVGSAKPVSSGKKAAKGSATMKIDAAGSKLEFVGAKVTGTHPGGFKKFEGTATLADGKAEGGSVTVEIDMDSMFSDSEKLTGHLKNADFFDVEKFKTAKFESTKIDKGGEGGTHTITGNLTLHGETKSIKFPASIDVDKGTVKAEFTINRKDFNVNYAGKADDLIKDDVVIKLDLKLAK